MQSVTRSDASLRAALAFIAAIVLSAAGDLPAGVADLKRPLPIPYDTKADAKAEIEQALIRAKADGKRVMVDFGGNWCTDCRVLAAVIALPSAARELDARFEWVNVDVGRYDRNMDVPQSYGLKLTGVPSLVVLNAEGKPVSDGVITDLTDARGMTPASVLDTLLRHAGPKS